MPVLENARHEKFAQELAKGQTAGEAYVLAGYVENDGNSIRLKGNERIAARVKELQEAAAERVEITIHDIADQLDEDRVFAKECKAPSACVSATMGKAKVLGLVVDKNELTGKNGGAIETASSDRQLAQLIAFTLAKAVKED